MRSEVVDPATQEEQAFPALDRKAVRQGWKVPDEMKPEVIDNLVAAVEMASADGDFKGVALNARVLLQADQIQYERDHPKETGEAKGCASVNVIQQVDLADLLRRAEAQRNIKHEYTSIASVSPLQANHRQCDG
jgi:hypothetical protein